jgi:hypothetical protein
MFACADAPMLPLRGRTGSRRPNRCLEWFKVIAFGHITPVGTRAARFLSKRWTASNPCYAAAAAAAIACLLAWPITITAGAKNKQRTHFVRQHLRQLLLQAQALSVCWSEELCRLDSCAIVSRCTRSACTALADALQAHAEYDSKHHTSTASEAFTATTLGKYAYVLLMAR